MYGRQHIQNLKSKPLTPVPNFDQSRMTQSKILTHFMVTNFSEIETALRNFGQKYIAEYTLLFKPARQ